MKLTRDFWIFFASFWLILMVSMYFARLHGYWPEGWPADLVG